MPYEITKECIGCTACAKQCPMGAISGKAKERHYISSPICIDCGVCGMACTSSAVLDPNGNVCKKESLKNRPKPVVDSELCSGCEACIAICPFSCLDIRDSVMSLEITGIAELVKPAKCVSCGQCERICAKNAITLENKVGKSIESGAC
ncbi:MAG: 4Fe-4S dicluster domain-containing protein [Candidatus Scalindua sp.]|nr:4Fe-4S dicluster domain-containing protein [Candidatus Scalindua sp.]